MFLNRDFFYMYITKSNMAGQLHIAEVVDEKCIMHILVGGDSFAWKRIFQECNV